MKVFRMLAFAVLGALVSAVSGVNACFGVGSYLNCMSMLTVRRSIHCQRA